MIIEPVILYGKIVKLVPLQKRHVLELAEAGSDEEIWKYMPYGPIVTLEKMSDLIDHLLTLQDHKTDLPFAVIYQNSGKVIGMTRFIGIEPANRGLEIGGTWYTRDYQHTMVNTECKFLLLRHAFEDLNCIRVQFKTDVRNERSQRALERIGAVKEGILRDHMILPDGTVRSSVYYSILAGEWIAVKQHFLYLMSR
ncbi:MAG TPA: GNAT family protein [Anaerolineaceae bacterium]|nr:GNAT family protein [Anaerolineaceae bacterium]